MMRIVPLTLAMSLLSACASTPSLDRNAQAVSVQEALPDPTLEEQTVELIDYRIGPSDELSVTVFNADELAASGQVDQAGNFLMPLIGNVAAAGMTTDEMAAAIADKLRGRYVKNPQVSVNITEARARIVTIDGAVQRPGNYPVVGRMTLQRAIATASGVTDVADPDKVVIFRTVGGQKMAAMFDLNEIRAGRIADPAVFGNDIIVVGESGMRRFLRDARQLPSLGQFIPIL